MSIQKLDINVMNINELNKYFSEYIEGIDFDKILNGSNEVNNQKKGNTSAMCPTCEKDDVIEDYSQGILVCRNCGRVLENILDYNPEWKQFEDDDKANGRCSMPINVLLPQSSLGTSISGMGTNRLKILHGWNAMPYKERSLNKEFKKIHDVCQKGGILKCVEDDAKIMYKMTSECKHSSGKNMGKCIITRGINRVSISAACVFFACIRKGVTRTSKEIALLYNIKDLEMNRGCKNLLKMLKIRKTSFKMGTSKPEHFIRRYCAELKIKNQFIEEALKIATNVERLNIASGHTPYSTAAASILLMAEMNKLSFITKKKLAGEFDISDVTIGKTLKEIAPYKQVLVDNEATDTIVSRIKKDMETQTFSSEVLEKMKKFGISPESPITIPTHSSKSLKDTVVSKNLVFSDDIDSDSEMEWDYEFNEEDEIERREKLHDKFVALKKNKKNKYDDELDVFIESYNLIKSISSDLNDYADEFMDM